MLMSKREKELVPESRFKEFSTSGSWGTEKLGGKALKVGSGITPKGGDKKYKEKGRPFVRSQNVGWGSLILDDVVYIDEKTHISFSSTEIKKDDVLLNITGASIGRSAIANQLVEGGNVNQHVCIIRTKKNELISAFLNQFLISQEGQRQIDNFQAGGNRQGLNFAQIRSFAIPIPPKIEEQQKVADCLASIDELITLHTQKLEVLKSHKKGLMQQLFPAEGETVPKLRFPEFRKAGPWKLKPIGKVLAEKQRPIDMEDDAEYSLVTVKRRYGGLVSRGIYKGRSIKVKSQFEVQENDFLISKRQIVHCACGVVPKELHGSIVSNEYSVLVPRKGNDVHFFDYFAQQPAVSLSFLQCSIGIVIEKMLFKLKDWLKEEFLFPEIEEQQKIAKFLGDFDEVIAKQFQKVESLKEHKKGLMQKLFPVMDEVL